MYLSCRVECLCTLWLLLWLSFLMSETGRRRLIGLCGRVDNRMRPHGRKWKLPCRWTSWLLDTTRYNHPQLRYCAVAVAVAVSVCLLATLPPFAHVTIDARLVPPQVRGTLSSTSAALAAALPVTAGELRQLLEVHLILSCLSSQKPANIVFLRV
jgi:hypothetical protein